MCDFSRIVSPPRGFITLIGSAKTTTTNLV